MKKVLLFPLLMVYLLFTSLSCKLFSSTKLSGYTNQAGNYGFNYPADWKAFESGSFVYFEFKEGKVECSVRPIAAGETLDSIRSEFEPVYFTADFSPIIIVNEPALQNNHIGQNGEIIGRTYFIIHNNLLYTIALFSDLESSLPKNFQDILKQFDELILSFRFLN